MSCLWENVHTVEKTDDSDDLSKTLFIKMMSCDEDETVLMKDVHSP